jgi:hypothetical protein
MKLSILSSVLLFFFLSTATAQVEGTFTYNGDRKVRVIQPGTGKAYTENFAFFKDLHFVQFGVYGSDYNVYDIKAPKGAGQVWLIYHPDTRMRSGVVGAYYIVQPFANSAEARQAVANLKGQKLDAWYNPELTGVEFVLLGLTGSF